MKYRYRWKIERTISWLLNYRRRVTRYEIHVHLFLGFAQLAALLTIFNRLQKPALPNVALATVVIRRHTRVIKKYKQLVAMLEQPPPDPHAVGDAAVAVEH